jgi:hypothetical protein
MIRSLVFGAGIIVAMVCSTCAPQPALLAPPPPPPGPGLLAAATCLSDMQPFLSHVQLLPSGYNPSGKKPNGHYNYESGPPATANPTPIDPNTSRYAAALQNAFLLAPPALQVRLCDPNMHVYVNGPESCSTPDCLRGGSWGYRASDESTYVAITAGLWNLPCRDGSTPYVYHCLETDLLNTTIDWHGMNANPPQYGPANKEADNFDMTALAALAHEVGHVRWYEIFNPDPNNYGKPYNPNPATFCSGTFFTNSWTNVHRPPYWRYHGARYQYNAMPDKHVKDPQISDIDKAINAIAGDPHPPTKLNLALSLLDQLYQADQPWASFFAALTPDEDFVETYKFWVLTNAQSNQVANEGPLTSLPISFVPGTTENIPYFYSTSKSSLNDKVICIGQYAF